MINASALVAVVALIVVVSVNMFCADYFSANITLAVRNFLGFIFRILCAGFINALYAFVTNIAFSVCSENFCCVIEQILMTHALSADIAFSVRNCNIVISESAGLVNALYA